MFDFGIRNPELCDIKFSSKNPESRQGLESEILLRDHQESGTCNPESTAWNPRILDAWFT